MKLINLKCAKGLVALLVAALALPTFAKPLESKIHREMQKEEMKVKFLVKAAYDGNYDNVVWYVDHGGVDPNIPDSHGNTALQVAATRGNLKIVEYLAGKAELEYGNKAQRGTALVRAAAAGHGEVVRLLIKRGAEVEAADSAGRTALMQAVNLYTMDPDKYKDVIDALVEEGHANVNTPANDKTTAIILAAEIQSESSLQVMNYLWEKGANVNQQGWLDNTALHVAIQRGDPVSLKKVEFLVGTAKADPTVKGHMGWTPLQKAKEYGLNEIVDYLNEHEAQ